MEGLYRKSPPSPKVATYLFIISTWLDILTNFKILGLQSVYNATFKLHNRRGSVHYYNAIVILMTISPKIPGVQDENRKQKKNRFRKTIFTKWLNDDLFQNTAPLTVILSVSSWHHHSDITQKKKKNMNMLRNTHDEIIFYESRATQLSQEYTPDGRKMKRYDTTTPNCHYEKYWRISADVLLLSRRLFSEQKERDFRFRTQFSND